MTNKNIYFSLLFFMCFSLVGFTQPIKPKQLLKKTEQSLKNINTVTYKMDRTDKFFTSKKVYKRSAIVTLYKNEKDELKAYHQMHIKSTDSTNVYNKYDGKHIAALFYHKDSLNHTKTLSITNVTTDGYSNITGPFIERFLITDYIKKQSILKQYRSLLAKILIKNMTTEEGNYKNTEVYILRINGKEKPRKNRATSTKEVYYIRKSDFLPIAYSFYGEFEGMNETEFTEIEYLEINPNLSLDFFKVDPTIKEVKPRAFYEESQKYNL